MSDRKRFDKICSWVKEKGDDFGYPPEEDEHDPELHWLDFVLDLAWRYLECSK